MENYSHILSGAFERQTRSTKIKKYQDELQAGMIMLGYNYYSLLEDEDSRQERVLAFQNEKHIVTFYLRPEETIGMKIFTKTNGYIRSTSNFNDISIQDARTIICNLL